MNTYGKGFTIVSSFHSDIDMNFKTFKENKQMNGKLSNDLDNSIDIFYNKGFTTLLVVTQTLISY